MIGLAPDKIQVALPYFVLLVLIYIGLSAHVILQRRKFRVSLGTGQSPALEKAVRIHGNFAEYVPMMMVMLVVLEINRLSAVLLNVFWICLVISRLAHIIGLSSNRQPHWARGLGMCLTGAVMIGSALCLGAQFLLV